jgi:hypothetical protein
MLLDGVQIPVLFTVPMIKDGSAAVPALIVLIVPFTSNICPGVAEPIPTLSVITVGYMLVPSTVHPATDPGNDHVALPELSIAVNTYPLSGEYLLIAKPCVRIVPPTSNN